METFVTSLKQKVNIHDREFCSGRCPFHVPSEHKMSGWPIVWRDDRQLVERLCDHEIGHPDPDSVKYLKQFHSEQGLTTHGCDGCCV